MLKALIGWPRSDFPMVAFRTKLFWAISSIQSWISVFPIISWPAIRLGFLSMSRVRMARLFSLSCFQFERSSSRHVSRSSLILGRYRCLPFSYSRVTSMVSGRRAETSNAYHELLLIGLFSGWIRMRNSRLPVCSRELIRAPGKSLVNRIPSKFHVLTSWRETLTSAERVCATVRMSRARRVCREKRGREFIAFDFPNSGGSSRGIPVWRSLFSTRWENLFVKEQSAESGDETFGDVHFPLICSFGFLNFSDLLSAEFFEKFGC